MFNAYTYNNLICIYYFDKCQSPNSQASYTLSLSQHYNHETFYRVININYITNVFTCSIFFEELINDFNVS